MRRGQREYHLARQLARHGHEVHFLSWVSRYGRRVTPGLLVESLRTGSRRDDAFPVHQARRLPNPFGERLHEVTGRGLRLNELFYQRAARRLVEQERIDLVICGVSHQAVGLPPEHLGVPLVFDYLDFKLERWPAVEEEYLRRADAVLCTSQVLVERTRARHHRTFYLPNGVDLAGVRRADPERVRRRYGLAESRVVSLIGVTAAERLFYVDAMAAAARRVPRLTFLLVGEGGRLGRAMSERAAELALPAVLTGDVPPSQVADFFAASEVGLYPAEQNAYFDAASPLKVLEYTAAGKPVVATDLAELRNWGFSNLRLVPPSAEAFAEEIEAALCEGRPVASPDLQGFDWSVLGGRLAAILEQVVAGGTGPPVPSPSGGAAVTTAAPARELSSEHLISSSPEHRVAHPQDSPGSGNLETDPVKAPSSIVPSPVLTPADTDGVDQGLPRPRLGQPAMKLPTEDRRCPRAGDKVFFL